MNEVPGSDFEIAADLVLLAMGFVSPVKQGPPGTVGGCPRQRAATSSATTDGAGCYATSVPKVFAAGDMRRGQSLVVWAIREGRQCAREVDAVPDGQFRSAALNVHETRLGAFHDATLADRGWGPACPMGFCHDVGAGACGSPRPWACLRRRGDSLAKCHVGRHFPGGQPGRQEESSSVTLL
jgi:hypothetical protein